MLAVWRGDLGKQLPCGCNPRFTEAVVRPLSLLPRGDDAGLHEDFHVIGQRGLLHAEALGKGADADLAAAQPREDVEPALIAKCFEYRCALRVRHGLRTPQIKIV